MNEKKDFFFQNNSVLKSVADRNNLILNNCGMMTTITKFHFLIFYWSKLCDN